MFRRSPLSLALSATPRLYNVYSCFGVVRYSLLPLLHIQVHAYAVRVYMSTCMKNRRSLNSVQLKHVYALLLLCVVAVCVCVCRVYSVSSLYRLRHFKCWNERARFFFSLPTVQSRWVVWYTLFAFECKVLLCVCAHTQWQQEKIWITHRCSVIIVIATTSSLCVSFTISIVWFWWPKTCETNPSLNIIVHNEWIESIESHCSTLFLVPIPNCHISYHLSQYTDNFHNQFWLLALIGRVCIYYLWLHTRWWLNASVPTPPNKVIIQCKQR